MGKRKSAAQIKRMIQRAQARGETYAPPVVDDHDDADAEENGENDARAGTEDGALSQTTERTKDVNDTTSSSPENQRDRGLAIAAKKLVDELRAIDEDTSLKAKDRRSTKRKAHAVAAEATGMASGEALMEWYETYKRTNPAPPDEDTPNKSNEGTANSRKKRPQGHHNPYIVFVGQFSYATTKERLMEHFQTELAKAEYKITPKSLSIRMLTDPKTKKSRGMAFVEILDPDPEMLYACLKLHHTYLDGRRINVERSAGGGREARKSKLKQLREDQAQHMDAVVRAIFQDFVERGDIREGELDEVAVSVCKRHTATVVEAAIEKYVESNGRDMDNPSAYFTFLVTKLAQEGIYEKREDAQATKGHSRDTNNHNKNRNNSRGSNNNTNTNKRQKTANDSSESRRFKRRSE